MPAILRMGACACVRASVSIYPHSVFPSTLFALGPLLTHMPPPHVYVYSHVCVSVCVLLYASRRARWEAYFTAAAEEERREAERLYQWMMHEREKEVGGCADECVTNTHT